MRPADEPLTEADLVEMEVRLVENAGTLFDQGSAAGGPVYWDNPLAQDVQRLLAEVRRLRAEREHAPHPYSFARECPICEAPKPDGDGA